MHFARLRRRPSASIVVAFSALFVSLGGAGYAATQLPAGSVGTAQLRNASVTNHKIANGSVGNFKLAWGAVGPRKMENGAVGKAQINAGQVQARITGTCSSGAVTSVSSTGTVTCGGVGGGALPAEFDTGGKSAITVPAGTAATTIASEPLAGGSSYLVSANPYVHIAGASAGNSIQVTCTLSVGPATSSVQTRSWTVSGGAGATQSNSIPLEVTAPPAANSITATVACTRVVSGTGSVAVSVESAINALQTASNTKH